MKHSEIRFNPNAMETVLILCSGLNITSLLDDMQRTVQAACSIWWTPVRLQVTGVNKRGLCDSAKSPKI